MQNRVTAVQRTYEAGADVVVASWKSRTSEVDGMRHRRYTVRMVRQTGPPYMRFST